MLSAEDNSLVKQSHIEAFLEKGMMLLDINIQYLNYLAGESQLIGAELGQETNQGNFEKMAGKRKLTWWDVHIRSTNNQYRNFLDLSPFI